MSRTKLVLWAGTSGMALLLAGCDTPGAVETRPDNEASSSASRPAASQVVSQDIEAPDVFQKTETGLWDGRPSLGGVWVAHPDVTDPERVLIRNGDNGQTVVGALFRRERNNPGPRLQVSSDAAAALGLVAGAPTELSVTALKRQEAAPEPEDVAEAEDLPISDEVPGAEAQAQAQEASEPQSDATEVADTGDTDAAPKPRRGWGLFRKKEPTDDATASDGDAIETTALEGVTESAETAANTAANTTASAATAAAATLVAATPEEPRTRRGLFARRDKPVDDLTISALETDDPVVVPPVASPQVPETDVLAASEPVETAPLDTAPNDAMVEDETPPTKKRWGLFRKKDPAEAEAQGDEIAAATVAAIAATAQDTSAPADLSAPAEPELVDGGRPVALGTGIAPPQPRRAALPQRERLQAAPASALRPGALTSTTARDLAVAPSDPDQPQVQGRRGYVQVGTYSLKSNAEATADVIRNGGIVPLVTEVEDQGTTYWAVLAGPGGNRAESNALLAKVKGLGYDDAFTLRR